MPETALLLEYLWVFMILVALEGVLAADNACVMAVIVKKLPEKMRQQALFWGLGGAFFFRLGSLFIIASLMNAWQLQAVGAFYLLFMSAKHLYQKWFSPTAVLSPAQSPTSTATPKNFWLTVLQVELADLAFAVDSILASIALAVSLPALGIGGQIGGMDAAKFILIFSGGFAGLVLMRFAAQKFVRILDERPSLETAAYLLVAWVGVKLLLYTLAHPALNILAHSFMESMVWKISFWGVFLSICLGGWFYSGRKTITAIENDFLM